MQLYLQQCATTRRLDTLPRYQLTFQASAGPRTCRLLSCLGERNSVWRFWIKLIPLSGSRPPARCEPDKGMHPAPQFAYWKQSGLKRLLRDYMLSEVLPAGVGSTHCRVPSDNTHYALHGVPVERPGVIAPEHSPPQDTAHTPAKRVPRYSPLCISNAAMPTANFLWRRYRWLPPPVLYPLPMQ